MPDPVLPYISLNLRDGTVVQVPKPSPRIKSEILDRLRAERLAKKISNMDAAKLDGVQRYAELEAFEDEGPWGNSRWIDYINSARGGEDVFLTVVQRKPLSKPDAESILDRLASPLIDVLIEMFDLERVRPKEPDENPPAPATNPTGAPPAYRRIDPSETTPTT